MSSLKVLVLADASAFHTRRFVAELRRHDCRVLPVSLERGPRHSYLLKRRGPFRRLHYALATFELRRLVKRFQPDVINPHYAPGYGYIAAVARRDHSTPIVLNVWGSDILIVPRRSAHGRLRVVRALRDADFVIGDSSYMISEASSLTPLASTRVIPWGIERSYLSNHRTDYTLGEPLRIIVPRRHEPIYNNEFILRSLAPLIEEGAVTLTFPSFGSLSRRFRRRAGRLLGSGVNLYDELSRSEFLRMFADHDVYLSASRSDSSPASLIEAMALGLIPVAADIPGVSEWLTDRSGFLFLQDDTQSLTSVVRGLTKSDDSYGDMRRANLDRVKREAIFEDNIAEQVRIMRDLAGWAG